MNKGLAKGKSLKYQLVEENSFAQSSGQSLYSTYVEKVMNDMQSSELLKRLLNSRGEASKEWVSNLHCEKKDK